MLIHTQRQKDLQISIPVGFSHDGGLTWKAPKIQMSSFIINARSVPSTSQIRLQIWAMQSNICPNTYLVGVFKAEFQTFCHFFKKDDSIWRAQVMLIPIGAEKKKIRFLFKHELVQQLTSQMHFGKGDTFIWVFKCAADKQMCLWRKNACKNDRLGDQPSFFW